LERVFYKTHNENVSSYYIINSSSIEYFSSSDINKEYTKFIVDIFGSNKESNLYLFIRNFAVNTNGIQVIIDDNPPKEICAGCWHLRKVELGKQLTVKVISDGLETVKEFSFLTEEDKLGYFKNGFIKFK